MQEGPQEERQILPDGREQGYEHGGQQLVGDHLESFCWGLSSGYVNARSQDSQV